MRRGNRTVAALAAIILMSGNAAAQHTPVRVAVDAMFGGGHHSESSGARWFKGREAPMARLALTATLSQSHVRPFLSIDRSSHASMADNTTECGASPNGTCRRNFPGLAGYSVGGGARIAVHPRLDLGVGAGVGYIGGRSAYADVDVAFAMLSHLRLVANVRQIEVWQSSTEHIWWRPFIVGLRLQ
jgi:hypothetical protein